jgi:hypothetical protein
MSQLSEENIMQRRHLLFLAISVLASFAVLAAAQAADISGEWELTIKTPRGDMVMTAKFTQDGEKLTVTMVGPRGGESKGEGTIQGNAVQWSVKRTGPDGNEFTVTYKGTVDGTAMSGTAENPRGTVDWKATKK